MAHNNDKTLSIIEQVFKTMPQLLDERQRRLLAASIAKAMAMAASNLSAKPVAWISAQYVLASMRSRTACLSLPDRKRSEKAVLAENL